MCRQLRLSVSGPPQNEGAGFHQILGEPPVSLVRGERGVHTGLEAAVRLGLGSG